MAFTRVVTRFNRLFMSPESLFGCPPRRGKGSWELAGVYFGTHYVLYRYWKLCWLCLNKCLLLEPSSGAKPPCWISKPRSPAFWMSFPKSLGRLVGVVGRSWCWMLAGCFSHVWDLFLFVRFVARVCWVLLWPAGICRGIGWFLGFVWDYFGFCAILLGHCWFQIVWDFGI